MTTTAFISYAHEDEKSLDRLHKHLAMLKRDGTLSTWSDHQIRPGDQFDSVIQSELERSQLFLPLVSPDFLASKYCYEKEFQHAEELATRRALRIVPIILEPCDWLSSPLKKYLALPKAGQPIAEWTNQNNAFLDIVNGLRRVLVEPAAAPQEGPPTASEQKARKPRVKKEFDAIQRADFADIAFATISRYFEASCRELTDAGEGTLKARFERMSDTAFTCTVVNRARRSGSEAHITVTNSKRRFAFGDISYVFQRHADENTSNGSVRVQNDEFEMFLTLDDAFGRAEKRLDSSQAAESLWLKFVAQAGIEYD